MEKRFVKKVRRYNNIIIYGAGLVGGLTARRLLANRLADKLIGFAVSKKESSDDGYKGLNIYEINELEAYKEEALVIIATMPALHNEIQEVLKEKGFKNTNVVTARLYKSFCKNYILDFRKENKAAFPCNEELRILFMASDNNRTSGAFLCMAELCQMLRERGISAMIILPQYGTGEDLLIQKGLLYTYIPSKDWGYKICKDNSLLKKIYFLIGQLVNCKARAELVDLIQKQSVDLIHCNTTYTYIGAVAAEVSGIPFVWHLRENMENQGYRIFARRWGIKLIQKADKVIAVSEYIRNIAAVKDPKLITVVYDAVEQENLVKRDRKILVSPIARMIIVGVIAPFKGQKELIEACGILIKNGITNFHLQIVGTGEKYYMEELMKQIDRSRLGDYISFYGVCSDIYSLYKQSDISFTCGAKEAYGRVTIEAMLSGCLVIGIDSGATHELIKNGKTGMLYEPGNIKSFAECIAKAISDSERSNRLAKNGQLYARKTFTKEKNLCQILDIYREILGEKVDRAADIY